MGEWQFHAQMHGERYQDRTDQGDRRQDRYRSLDIDAQCFAAPNDGSVRQGMQEIERVGRLADEGEGAPQASIESRS